MDAQRLQVLLASASESDLDSVRDGLSGTGAGIDLHVAHDGNEATGFLRCEGRYEGALRPDVIVLDLGLPGDGAARLLDLVHSTPDLEHLQVVAILGEDTDAGHDAIAGHRIHDTVRRPIGPDTLRPVIAYFSEL